MRDALFFAKSQMKRLNTNRSIKVSVHEQLTDYNISLMDKAKDKLGKTNVWTSKCRIFGSANGSSFRIKTEADITKPRRPRPRAAPSAGDTNNPSPDSI